MEDMTYKVYILRDKNNCITDVWSTGNQALGDKRTEETMMELGYIKIDEGSDGEIYGRAQVNYLEKKHNKPMYDERMIPNFKYVDDEIVALTDEEKEEFYPPVEPQPSEIEILKQKQELTDKALQDLILMTLGGE